MKPESRPQSQRALLASPTPSVTGNAGLRITLLGKFRVSLGERSVDEGQWRLSKARSLVKLLALSSGHSLHREQIIELLWPDLPADAATNNLHQVLFAARRALVSLVADGSKAHPIEMTRQVLALRSLGENSLWVDVEEFEQLAAIALQEDNAEVCYQAIELYGGDLLPEDRYEDWVAERRDALRERYIALLLRVARLHEERGERAPAIDALRRLIAVDPAQEAAHAGLMRLYALTDRPQQALRQYERLREILEREFDAEPDPATDRLYRAILDRRFPPPASARSPGVRPVAQPPVALGSAPAPSPSVPAPPVASTFIGRERELDILREAFERSGAGAGSVILVSGEAGIGKTRLVEEFGRRLQGTNGARLLWGRCYEGEGPLAYWPWAQIVRAWLRDVDPEIVAADMGPGAADIARLVPDVRQILPGLPDPAPIDPDQERFRLFDSVLTFLKNAAARSRLILALDDLQWADRSSMLLLEFIADELRDSRLLIVAIHRDLDSDHQRPLSRTLTRVIRGDPALRIHLTGLNAEQVARVSEIAAGRPPPPGLAEAIHYQTEGNPLFVREIVQLLLEEERFTRPADVRSWRVTIPRGVREAIDLRLERLSEETIRLLVMAAAIGRDFDLNVLAPVAELTPDRAIEALEEALAADVLTESPTRPGGFHFVHGLTRQALYESISSARRLRLHRYIGEAIERAFSANLEPHLADLARHFFLAAPTGSEAQAIEYSFLAGAQAMDRVAWVDATGHFRRALDLVQAQHPPDERTRCELLLLLGKSLDISGESADARSAFLQAAHLARDAGLAIQFANAAISFDTAGGRTEWIDEGEIQLLEDALVALGESDDALRVQLLSRLAIALYYCVPLSDDRRVALSREALAIAERLGDPATLAQALIGRIYALWPLEAVDERLADATEVVRLARESGDKRLEMIGHAWRMYSLVETGDMAAVDRAIEAYEQLGESLRQPHSRFSVLVRRTMRALMAGRFDEGARLADETLAIGQRVAPGPVAINALMHQFVLWREREDCPEPAALLRHLMEQAPTSVLLRSLQPSMSLIADRREEARREYQRLVPRIIPDMPRDIFWLATVSLLSETCATLGDTAHAETLYALLRPFATRNVSLGANPVCFGSASRFLGLLATTLSWWEQADEHFNDAARMNRAMNALPDVAHTLFDHARMLARREQRGDADRAIALTEQSLDIARAAGMTRLTRRARLFRAELEHE